MMFRVILDTNVLVAGLRSNRGASYQLLQRVDEGSFTPVLSVPLVFEYEEVLKRQSRYLGLSHKDLEAIVDYLCDIGEHRRIFFLWRPVLPDPRDDLILELAVEAGVDGVVTFNTRDFAPAAAIDITIWTPPAFLERLGEVR